jgi:hypothetical protein
VRDLLACPSDPPNVIGYCLGSDIEHRLAPTGGLKALGMVFLRSAGHFAEGESDCPYDRLRFDFADGHHLAYINP